MSASRPNPLTAPFRSLGRHRTLIWALAMRDILSPHAGQMLGPLWAVLSPLLFIALLTVIFNVLLGARFGISSDLPLDYSAFILAGLVPWQTVAIVLGRGCVEIIGNASMVKQVVFPSEILPIRGVIASLPIQVIGMIYLAGNILWKTGSLPWTWALVPLLFAFQLLFMFGCALLLSALCVYLRDLIELVRLLTIAGLYLSPVVYIPSMIPDFLWAFLYSNPFSYMIWCYQDACVFGRFEHPFAWWVFTASSLVVFIAGFHTFRKLKHFFGNAL